MYLFFLLVFPLLLPAAESACINCGGADKTSAKRLKMPNKSVFTRLAGIELMEIFEITNQINHEVCAQQCDAHAECAVFEFNLPNKLCVLASEYARLSEDLAKGAFETIVFVKVRGKFTKALPKDKETCLDKSEYEDYVKHEVDKWLKPSPRRPSPTPETSSTGTTDYNKDTDETPGNTSEVPDADTKESGDTATETSSGPSSAVESSATKTSVASEKIITHEENSSPSESSTRVPSTSSTTTVSPKESAGTTTILPMDHGTKLAPTTTATPPSATVTSSVPEVSSTSARSDSSMAGGSTTVTMDRDGGKRSTEGATQSTEVENTTQKTETSASMEDTKDPTTTISTQGSETSSGEPSTYSSSSSTTSSHTDLGTTLPNKIIGCTVTVSGIEYKMADGDVQTVFGVKPNGESKSPSEKYGWVMNQFSVLAGCFFEVSSSEGSVQYGPFTEEKTETTRVIHVSAIRCQCI